MKLYFDHAATVVPDIAEAVNWYLDAIPGTTVLYQDASWAFLDAHGTKLAFVVKSQHPSHLAWRVSQADLEALAEKHGKTIEYHRDGTRGFYMSAPGGAAVEIICMTGTRWEVPGEDTTSE
jgi:hypothetical protein